MLEESQCELQYPFRKQCVKHATPLMLHVRRFSRAGLATSLPRMATESGLVSSSKSCGLIFVEQERSVCFHENYSLWKLSGVQKLSARLKVWNKGATGSKWCAQQDKEIRSYYLRGSILMASLAADMSVVMTFASDVVWSTDIPRSFGLDGKDKGKEDSNVGRLHCSTFVMVEWIW